MLAPLGLAVPAFPAPSQQPPSLSPWISLNVTSSKRPSPNTLPKVSPAFSIYSFIICHLLVFFIALTASRNFVISLFPSGM